MAPLYAHLCGIALVVLGFLGAAIQNAFAKTAVETIPITTLLFVQNIIAFALVAPCIIGHRFAWKENLSLHLARALSGLLSFACLFLAIRYISLVNATLLANAAPLFFPLIIRVWEGERVTSRLWGSILLGFAGVIFILHPSAGSLGSWMVLVALLGSLFSAIALQCVRKLVMTESLFGVLFYYFLFSTILCAPPAFFFWEPLNNQQWLLLATIGLFLGITQLLLAKAYTYASPTILGPFNYSIVIFAGLIQWIFWGTIPDAMGFAGIFFIALGGLLTLFQQRHKSFK